MKIRTQNLLAIIPLFLSLALISGALMYTAERQELFWGLTGQVQALAVTTAEFIDGDTYRTVASQGARSPSFPIVQGALQEVMIRNQPQRILALTSDGRRIVMSLAARNLDADPIEPGLVQAMAQNEIRVTEVRLKRHGDAVITAYAPIHDHLGNAAGIIAIDLDARDYLTRVHQVFYEIAAVTTIVLLMGIAVVTFLTRMVTREVRDLNRAAVELAEGRLVAQIQPGRIREVGDLSNTFNTMNDVLKDVLDKTKRTLIEAKQFQTRTDLAKMYSELFWAPTDETIRNVHIVAQHMGSRPNGAFWGVFPVQENSCAVMGRLKSDEDLDAILSASAAYTLLQQVLPWQAPDGAFARAADLFQFDILECLMWDANSAAIAHWRFNPGLGISSQETLTLTPGEPIVMHTFEAELRKTIEDYVARFGYLPPDELIKDLMIAVPASAEGTILIAGWIKTPAAASV